MKKSQSIVALLAMLAFAGPTFAQAKHLSQSGKIPGSQPDSLVISQAQRDSGEVAADSSVRRSAQIELPPGAADTTTLNFKDTDIRDVFRGLAYQHGLNIFVDNSINKRVTISLNKVLVYDAIEFLCKQNSLNLSLSGSIFQITSPLPPRIVPPPKPKPYVAYESGHIWIAARDVDLQDVVQAVRDKSARNILVTEGTDGSVTGELDDIGFDIGFTQIMNNNGFAVQKRDGIYIVSRVSSSRSDAL